MAKAESLARSNQIPQNSIFKGLFINFRGDLTGGLTTAVVTIPLALAFAVASGMEPKAGIYTAIVAGVVATVFGGSPVQITGPTGSMAVILVGVVAKYGIEKVWIASVMAGIIQIALGVAKLGRLVKFIPYPVIVGFTNGIAVIIFCSQLNDFLGLHLPNQEHFFQALWQTITNLESYNWFAIALAILTIGTKLLWERINQSIPGSLISLIVATLAAIVAKSQWNLEVPTIGLIPQSLPMPQSIPYWNDFQVIRELITPAIALAALGSIESLLTAVVADGMIVGDRHNSDKQLIGQGLANMIVPFFGGFPATGTISRTAVNVRAGGKTRLSGVIHSVALALIVLAFAPLASQVPMAV